MDTLDLILASQSPRRRRLLTEAGFAFTVHPSSVDETVEKRLPPEELVTVLALRKARQVAAACPEQIVLGADTVVAFENEILEKPADAAEAAEMLRRLSGAVHTVHTGLALVHRASRREVTATEETRVTFRPLSDASIDAYVATGRPLDKAGGYGIQDDSGARFVATIDGPFDNVVGLPMALLRSLLHESFGDIYSISDRSSE